MSFSNFHQHEVLAFQQIALLSAEHQYAHTYVQKHVVTYE